MSMKQPKKILVRGPNPVGDLVMATASFADIRRRFPDATITLLLKSGREDVIRGATYYDDVILDDSSGGLRRLIRLARELRRRRFDLCVLFTQSLRTALLVALAGIPLRVGYSKGGQGPLLHRRVKYLRSGRRRIPTSMTETYARLCEAVEVERGDGWPQLSLTSECEEAYSERRHELGIAPGEKLVGLVPGASFGSSKLWPSARLAELSDRVTDRYGLRTIIFAGPGEEKVVAEFFEKVRTKPLYSADRPLGLDLLKPFVRDLKLLVTMDTGPRHYASAFRVPTLVIMGSTDPRWTASNLDYQEVVRHDVPCGPCQLKVCPVDHRCMTSITVDEVMDRIEVLDARLGIFS